MEGGAHGVGDLFEGVEDTVAEVVFSQMPPDVFDRIKFGAVGWQEQQAQVRRQAKIVRAMPARAIQQHHPTLVGMLSGEMGQEHGHRLGVDPRHHQRTQFAFRRANRAQGVKIFPNHLMSDARTLAKRRPAAAQVADAAEPRLILEP